jgi:hypothetical protein
MLNSIPFFRGFTCTSSFSLDFAIRETYEPTDIGFTWVGEICYQTRGRY